MNTQRKSAGIALLLVTTFLITACSGGGSGNGSTGSASKARSIRESEPNDNATGATPIAIGDQGEGDLLTPGDKDLWRIRLQKNQVVRIELHGIRRDHDVWEAAPNNPEVAVLDSDGQNVLTAHSSADWSWYFRDLDIPRFRAPKTGEYLIRVQTAEPTKGGGRYWLHIRKLNLGPLQFEQETRSAPGSNDTADSAERIRRGTLVGYYDDTEADYYSFRVDEASIVRFEIWAYRLGMHEGSAPYYDPHLSLFDQDGTSLLADREDVVFWDSMIHFLISEPGTYFLRVTEFPEQTGSGEYFLDFSSEPLHPTLEVEPNDGLHTAMRIQPDEIVEGLIEAPESDYYVYDGKAGEMLRIQFFDKFRNPIFDMSQAATASLGHTYLDANNVPIKVTHTGSELNTARVLLKGDGKFFMRVEGNENTLYHFKLTVFKSAPYESEDNDSVSTADSIGGSDRMGGRIHQDGDIDFFSFTAQKGETICIRTYASNADVSDTAQFELDGHGSELSPYVVILDPQETMLAQSMSTEGLEVFPDGTAESLATNTVTFTAPKTGVFYLMIGDSYVSGSPDHTYLIELDRHLGTR